MMDLFDRLWSAVDKTPGHGPEGTCWLWTGLTSSGYGRFTLRKRAHSAHRLAYISVNGDPGDGRGRHGKQVLHRCDVRLCCNPGHMFIGTPADNVKDCQAKGRRRYAIGEKARHNKLTATEVLAIRNDARMYIDISAEYGISMGQISRIKHRANWKHLP